MGLVFKFLTFIVIVYGLSFNARASASYGLELGIDYQNFFSELNQPTRKSDIIIETEAFAAKKWQSSEFKLRINARSNSQSDVESELLFINPKEAFWKYRSYPWQILIGFNTYNWGIFDLYSPADNLSPKSYLDLFNSQRIGSPVVDILFEKMNWSFQMIYIPYQSHPVLPAEDSRWLPREVLLDTSTEDLKLKLPEEFAYVYSREEVLKDAFRHNYGGRFTLRLDRSDIGLSFYEGLASTPNFFINVSGVLSPDEANTVLIDSDVELRAIYYKQRNSSFQLTQLIGPLIFRIETLYSDTLGSVLGVPAWSHQNAMGLEYSFRTFGKQLSLILNYYFGKSNEVADNLVSGSGNFFQNSLGFGSRLSLTSQSSMSLGGLFSLEDSGYFIQFTSESKLSRYFSFLVSIETIGGSQESFLGSFSKNDRIRGQLKIYF